MRKAIPKKIREQVYQKFKGHCAYCGCELEYKDMQVDHINSVYRSMIMNQGVDESLENYMPACRACNFYKGTYDLESFRDNLSTRLYRNLAKNFNYKLLLKYGLIKENIHKVKFYFEMDKEE